MTRKTAAVLVVIALILAGRAGAAPDTAEGVFDVRAFGAKGDGATPDTDAINRAIAAASAAGGGTVRLGAGTYPAGAIHLQSRVGEQP